MASPTTEDPEQHPVGGHVCCCTCQAQIKEVQELVELSRLETLERLDDLKTLYIELQHGKPPKPAKARSKVVRKAVAYSVRITQALMRDELHLDANTSTNARKSCRKLFS